MALLHPSSFTLGIFSRSLLPMKKNANRFTGRMPIGKLKSHGNFNKYKSCNRNYFRSGVQGDTSKLYSTTPYSRLLIFNS